MWTLWDVLTLSTWVFLWVLSENVQKLSISVTVQVYIGLALWLLEGTKEESLNPSQSSGMVNLLTAASAWTMEPPLTLTLTSSPHHRLFIRVPLCKQIAQCVGC